MAKKPKSPKKPRPPKRPKPKLVEEEDEKLEKAMPGFIKDET